jgi:Flp pilus assembly protein TadD
MGMIGRLSMRPELQLAAAAALLAGAAAAVWYSFRPAPAPPPPATESAYPDPRLTYQGPYRNVHPEAASVGSSRCADCHADIARKYSQHPMGRSVAPVADRAVGDLAERASRSFSAFGSQFRVEREGNRLWSTETRRSAAGEPLFEVKLEIDYAIGSGTKGHSFLSDRDGFVTQSAVSWFSQKHIWDASPGFPPDLHTGRPIQFECLFCHTNAVVPVKGTLNRYETPLFRDGHSIGCERCHGPGAEHVRQQERSPGAGLPDYTIVNPGRLEPALREAVCQQCHLEGEARIVQLGRSLTDYRPGLPLDSVLSVLVRDHGGEDRKAVNHVEQMYLSKCYTKSGGALGCITCHDPHEKASPEKRNEQYRAACLKCHNCSAKTAERARRGSPDNCTACHMPQFAASDIVHTATTDHRIVRIPEKSKSAAPGRTAISARPSLFFPKRKPDLLNRQEASAYALGLLEAVQDGKASASDLTREVLPLLEQAIAGDPKQARLWEGKAITLALLGRKSEALAAAQQGLALETDSEATVVRVAGLAAATGQKELAVDCWRKAIAIHASSADYRQALAILLAQGGDWAGAQHEAEQAVQADPARSTARTILAIARARGGDSKNADALFHTVELLQPPNLNQLRAWYRARSIAP